MERKIAAAAALLDGSNTGADVVVSDGDEAAPLVEVPICSRTGATCLNSDSM